VHSLAVRLMQHLVVPTFVLDAEHRVTIWNHACERLTGIPAAEIVGTGDQWRGFYSEARRPAWPIWSSTTNSPKLDRTLRRAHQPR
jgi:PAS domain-containing protein